jgi:hypothetical protein
MQELSHSTKRPNLRTMSIEGEEVQAKGILNIFNKIITYFPKCRESFAINRTLTELTKIEHPHGILSLKQKRILKAVREKRKYGIKVNSSKITADFSMVMNENNFNPRILYPAKLSFKIDGGIKIFHNTQKTKTVCDHQAITTEDSTRNSAHRK